MLGTSPKQLAGSLARQPTFNPTPVTPNRPQYMGNTKNIMFIRQPSQQTLLGDSRTAMKPDCKQEVRRPGKQAFLDMQSNGRFSPTPNGFTPQTQMAMSSSMIRNPINASEKTREASRKGNHFEPPPCCVCGSGFAQLGLPKTDYACSLVPSECLHHV
eukprot:1194474-Prorocentrum_minimum.AAC.3